MMTFTFSSGTCPFNAASIMISAPIKLSPGQNWIGLKNHHGRERISEDKANISTPIAESVDIDFAQVSP